MRSLVSSYTQVCLCRSLLLCIGLTTVMPSFRSHVLALSNQTDPRVVVFTHICIRSSSSCQVLRVRGRHGASVQVLVVNMGFHISALISLCTHFNCAWAKRYIFFSSSLLLLHNPPPPLSTDCSRLPSSPSSSPHCHPSCSQSLLSVNAHLTSLDITLPQACLLAYLDVMYETSERKGYLDNSVENACLNR